MITTTRELSRTNAEVTAGEPVQASLPVLGRAMFGLAVFLFSGWDIYLSIGTGLRIFDFVGTGILVGLVLFGRSSKVISTRLAERPVAALGLVLLGLTYVVLGALSDLSNAKAGTGILMGLLIFAVCYSQTLGDKDLTRLAGFILTFHIAFAVIQYILVSVNGYYLDPFAVLNLQSRIYSSVLRIAGFFQEPAHFALLVCTMLLVYLKSRENRSIDIVVAIVAFGTALCLSLWGAVALPIILLIWLDLRSMLNWVIITALSIAVGLAWNADLLDSVYLVDRVVNLENDPSATIRYGGLLDLVQTASRDPLFWIGHGVSWNFLEYGENGLSYALYGLGLIGTASFLTLIASLAPAGDRVRVLASIVLVLTATPIWGYMYFWAWLALLARGQPDNGR